MASQPATSENLFEVALHTVQSGLSDADKRHFRRFADHRDMLADLRRSVCRYSVNSGKLLRCSQRVAAFSNAFAPFFDVIGVFVQIKPEYAAVFWGTIWFIFKIGSNLVNFLERVSDLFEEISFILPQYESWFEICRNAPQTGNSNRLAHAMGFIYHDIIEFCMHIYFMFSKQDGGRIKRALLGAELLLRPFDSRFSRLKERLDMHRAWFEVEARIQEHNLTVKTYGDFRLYVRELENLNAGQAQRDQSRLVANDIQKLRDLKRWLDAPDYATLYEGMSERIFPGTGQWILQRPEYLNLKQSILLEDAGSVGDEDPHAWLKRILFLHAKPGFGKSFLSVIMINDLLEMDVEDTDAGAQPHVAFFHFSQLNRITSQTEESALRAIATQLVHSNRRDRISLDALAMIETDSGSGQSVASPRDVRVVIDILLRRHPTFIILDGVDECQEPERLLEAVRKVSLEHNCRFILLGRPNVRIPPQWAAYDGQFGAVDLRADFIFDDLKAYLESRLQSMASRRLFGEETRTTADLVRQTSPSFVEDLARQSEGLFLWAQLLVNLLESPALSPGDRFHVLANPGYLEGLDGLYERTLDVLRRKLPKEQQVAQTLFRWICCSAIPLTLKALHIILAINPGRQTSQLDYLPDYPGCIPFITVALVEVLPSQDTLSFIHVTFKDFLISSQTRMTPNHRMLLPSPEPHRPRSANAAVGQYHRYAESTTPMDGVDVSRRGYQSSGSVYGQADEFRGQFPPLRPGGIPQDPRPRIEFTIEDLSEVHFAMTTTCLSHLVFDIPSKPLTEVGNNNLVEHWEIDAMSNTIMARPEDELRILAGSNQVHLDSNYPFLRYCSLYWDSHLYWAHETGGPMADALRQLERPPQWLTLLSQFLLDRLTVTAWVEAAHTYHHSPRISHLARLLAYLRPTATPAATPQARECQWTYLGLQQLAQALKHLQQRYGRDLLANPRRIWSEEIVMAEDDEFWPNWMDESHVRVPEQGREVGGETRWRYPGNIASPSGYRTSVL